MRRFTILFYRTVNLMRTSNNLQKNRHHQEKGKNVQQTAYGTIFLSRKCKINVGKTFFKLLTKNFRKNNKYHKIFNQSNKKVSCSCIDNMTKLINYHNKHVAPEKDQTNQNLYNCRNHDNYPLDNKCLTSKIGYSTEIITDNRQPSKVYLGISETEFKTRFDKHQMFFRHWQNGKGQEISKQIKSILDSHRRKIKQL